MRVRSASEAGEGAENEDGVAWGAGWAFVLDGATAPPGVDTGCRHGVGWFVRQLTDELRHELPSGRRTLSDSLATAIARSAEAHRATCDLENPDSPSATVAVARHTGRGTEYLALADAVVLAPGDGAPACAITDDRLDHLPGGRPYSQDLVRACRNAPGGFWVAGTDPEAAYQALQGTFPGRRFALLTDGCWRLVDYYGHSVPAVADFLDNWGPEALIAWVRSEERRHGVPSGKLHDDATALLAEPGP